MKKKKFIKGSRKEKVIKTIKIKLKTPIHNKKNKQVHFFNLFSYKKKFKCKLKNLCMYLIKLITNYFVNK